MLKVDEDIVAFMGSMPAVSRWSHDIFKVVDFFGFHLSSPTDAQDFKSQSLRNPRPYVYSLEKSTFTPILVALKFPMRHLFSLISAGQQNNVTSS